MPHPFPLASVFTEGMRRDVDRTMLPGGSVYNLVDFVPDELGAAAVGRGGWTYAGPTLGGIRIENVGFHPDSGNVIAIDNTQKGWIATSGVAITGTSTYGGSKPSYHRGKLIFTGANGAVSPTYYDGTSISTLSSAPPGTVSAVYKDRTVLANTSANPNRVWFSAAGDPTTWDTSFGWWDTTGHVSGLASLLNAILVFHPDSTERLRGTTPPPGSDMALEPVLNVGCIDPFSIAYWQQRIIFCSAQGIYLTDGATSVDLTAAAQMKTYWQSLLTGFTSGTWQVAGGIYRDHYIVSIMNGSTFVDCLCVSLLNQTMWRLTNIGISDVVNVTAGQQEKCYVGQWNAGRVIELSSLWSPSASVKQDGDGTNPTPIIETGSYRGWDRLHRRWIESQGLQKWRFAYLDYDLRDAASDNPTISLSFATTPTGGYTSMVGGNIPESIDYSRARRSIHGSTVGAAARSNMMEFKLAVNGPYAAARVYAIEAAFEPIDIGRLK